MNPSTTGEDGKKAEEPAGGASPSAKGPEQQQRKTLEKRVRESSGVSSSSGECTSGESRAAADDAYTKGNSNEEAGSQEHKGSGECCERENGDKSNGSDDHACACVTDPSDGGKPKLPRPSGTVECPRCNSKDTKFCYYNNYNIKQPRYFCKSCQRYWTSGGTLRNVPVGAGRRKHKSSSKSDKSKNDVGGGVGGLVSPGLTQDQFSPGVTWNKNSMALTYAAVAALKPQQIMVSYPTAAQTAAHVQVSQPMATSGPDGQALSDPSLMHQKTSHHAGASDGTGGGNAHPSNVVQDRGTNKTRSRSRNKKKKQFVLANHLESSQGEKSQGAAGMQWQGVPRPVAATLQQQQAYQQALQALQWQQLAAAWAQQQTAAQTLMGATGPPQQQANEGSGDQQQQQQQAVAAAAAASAQGASVPWWYTQMVNNLAASQNPSGMARSFNLQFQEQQQQQANQD